MAASGIAEADVCPVEARGAGPGARVVFVMPRCRHAHVRGVHKQAHALAQAGFEVVLLVRPTPVGEYLGMRVVSARAGWGPRWRSLAGLPALLRQVLGLDGDLHVLRNPDTIPLAVLLRLAGRRVIYDSQEDFSRRPLIRDRIPRGLRRPVAWLVTGLERLLARYANGVIVTQSQQVGRFRGSVLLLPNAPLVSGPVHEASVAAAMHDRGPEIRLLYAGEISELRGIGAMLDLVEDLNRIIYCRLELLGHFLSAATLARAERHGGWRFVDFRGHVSHAEALARMRSADIGLALLQPVADFPTSSITKLGEYMAAGLPFVASDFPAWRVATFLGPPGLYVDPQAPGDVLVATLRLAKDAELRDALGQAGQYHVAGGYNWSVHQRRFVEFVHAAAGARVAEGALR